MEELIFQIKHTIDTNSKEQERDFVSIQKLINNGNQQVSFNNWLLSEVKTKGRNGWWNPMCLFRSFKLRGKDPGIEKSNEIRAKIRAAVVFNCPFTSKAWNKDENRAIFNNWEKKNQKHISEMLLLNSGKSQVTLPKQLFPEVVDEEKNKYAEGAKKKITVNSYERDLKARQKCIEEHGYVCVVCGFNFEKTYGAIGKYFIHVHHLKPISEIGKSYVIEPTKDLCPLCPNCHSMVHQRKPPFSIEELKQIIVNQNK